MDVTIEVLKDGSKTISVYDIEPGNNPEAIIAAVTAVHSAMFPDEPEVAPEPVKEADFANDAFDLAQWIATKDA